MNVSRLVASVGGYFYSTGDDVLAVHLYGGSSARVSVGGREVAVKEVSNYPWSGDVRIGIDPRTPAEFRVMLRIPGWVRGARVRVNGTNVDVDANMARGYLSIRRTWKAGDQIEMELPMPVERVYANPHVRMDVGRAALMRGPLVYCAEAADNTVAVERLRLPRTANVTARQRPDLFGGIVTLETEGTAVDDAWRDDLYRNAPPKAEPATWTAIPYFLWNNRGPGAMAVWVPEQ
jgi:DUF1680 family protein